MKSIATIAIQTETGESFTDYMLVDVDPRDGTWEPVERCADGAPFVYDTLSEAEQILEELDNGD